MIGTASLAGQVTVPWSRLMRNCCLVNCPAGAVGSATLIMAVMPSLSSSASNAPMP
jgi:hypothetical protein